MNLGAKQARELLENRDKVNSEIWFEKAKYLIFEDIRKAALKGNESIKFKPMTWQDNDNYKRTLISQLTALDYSVLVKNQVMVVSW